MTEEIKEMINEIKETVDGYLETYKLKDDVMYDTINYKASQWYKLLDYITNLQQENERLEHENLCLREYHVIGKKAISNELIKDKNFMKILDMPTYEDYKSRCEKAIEYIMTELITEWDIKNDGCVSGSDLPVDAITPILNILNGSDEK